MTIANTDAPAPGRLWVACGFEPAIAAAIAEIVFGTPTQTVAIDEMPDATPEGITDFNKRLLALRASAADKDTTILAVLPWLRTDPTKSISTTLMFSAQLIFTTHEDGLRIVTSRTMRVGPHALSGHEAALIARRAAHLRTHAC